MKNNKYLAIPAIMILLTFCAKPGEEYDANGHFETREVLVSSENSGRLVSFIIEAGMTVNKGQVVGMVDTMALFLNKEQVNARVEAAMLKIPGIKAQKNVVVKEIEALDFEISRVASLVKNKAATQKQLDDLHHTRSVANARLEAFETQIMSVKAEVRVLEAQLDLLNEQISRSAIKAPIDGLVLERYARESEIVSPGKILFSVASTSKMELKAYISGSQLSMVEIGQTVKVRIDWEETDYREYRGIITWVADEAEFTPKIIQTKEERVNLVYAIKIQVENDGKIKIGMPGEAIF